MSNIFVIGGTGIFSTKEINALNKEYKSKLEKSLNNFKQIYLWPIIIFLLESTFSEILHEPRRS